MFNKIETLIMFGVKTRWSLFLSRNFTNSKLVSERHSPCYNFIVFLVKLKIKLVLNSVCRKIIYCD